MIVNTLLIYIVHMGGFQLVMGVLQDGENFMEIPTKMDDLRGSPWKPWYTVYGHPSHNRNPYQWLDDHPLLWETKPCNLTMAHMYAYIYIPHGSKYLLSKYFGHD